MMNCWSIGAFLVLFLGSFCLWNCLTRDELLDSPDWHGCRDQNGKPVDEFVVYKLPKDRNSPFGPLREGSAYMYLTPETAVRLQSGGVSSVLSQYSDSASGWVLSNISINHERSMLAWTLSRLYSDPERLKNTAYIMYNDEFPNNTKSFTKGHTKGVVLLTELGGFWLIHSVPKYPPPPEDGYSYPSSGQHYGQTMLCISLPAHQANNVGQLLFYNEPFIYSSNMPSALEQKFAMLDRVIRGDQHPQGPQWFRIVNLISQRGKRFMAFAKYRKYNDDLYSGLVAPVLKTNIAVETWRNGPHPLPSSCNGSYRVMNVQSVTAKAAATSFSTHHDHSKWAVATQPDSSYVCIGDINRMETQFHRGGGTVCMWSLSIWHRFHSLVQSEEVCPMTG
ncbi:deoxyribonuclease-2-alpha [Penaeus vannamei]|uniref:Uncharacterized protein n=1 Tax=Penaeus vannamei TaxID=6689 RepID=A0A423U4K2_PENVA|nr:deoxyribonuclease-2-alpha-like [Penaeus vannamei]ROT83636.1 hypothetical protein C7M84_023169 [Penaeus vannamei]